VWVHIYTERSDGAHADADSYTRTQTEQSGNKTTRTVWSGNGESDRSCTVYANEQHQYGFRLRQYTVMLTCKLLLAAVKAIVDVGPDMPQQS